MDNVISIQEDKVMKKLIAVLLALSLMVGFATVVSATGDVPSATTPKEHQVEIRYELDPVITIGRYTVADGDTYTFTAPKEYEGHEFDRFEIDGQYELVSRDGNTIVIRPHEDIVIHVYFKDVEPHEDPHDPSPVSPHTGVDMFGILFVMVLGIFGVFVACKKLLPSRR